MFRTLPFVLCLVAVSHQFDVTKFSVPSAVEVGGDAELSCEHDASDRSSIIKWWWTPAGSNDKPYHLYQRTVFSGNSSQQLVVPQMEPPLNYTIKTDDQDNLLLWDLQPEHSGTFECEITEEIGDCQERRNSSDLVVYTIGDGPNMTFVEDEEVKVICEAIGVAPEPDMTISYDSYTFNATQIDGPTDGLYNVSANVTLSKQDIEGVEIFCKLSFKDADIPNSPMMVVSDTYHSDAWLATTTEAPDETTKVQATLETALVLPNSAEHLGAWAGLMMMALGIPHLGALLFCA